MARVLAASADDDLLLGVEFHLALARDLLG